MDPRRRDPLVGKRIVVTRAEGQAESLCLALQERGAHPVHCPTIRLEGPEQWAPLDRALQRLDAFDWVVFTSVNGVRFALDRSEAIGMGADALRSVRVAVVGTRTARALEERGIEAAFVAPDEGSIPLAEALGPVEGAAILMARSDLADPVAGQILRRRGAREVREVVAYRTLPVAPEGPGLLELRLGIDGITFTSPSTVHGLVALGPEWRRLVSGAIVATLGPTTTGAAREAGLAVEEADEKSIQSLVEALARGFALRSPQARGRAGKEGTAK
jgi:uroporphyrinogen III methyltransferase / synthase